MSEAMMEKLARRLERVERENRRLKRGAVAIAGVIVAAVLMGQGGSKSRIIEAEGFKLVDAAGVPRGGLVTFPDGSVVLRLSDKDGKAGANLFVEADGSVAFALSNKDGMPGASLNVKADGSVSLALADKGKATAGLQVGADQSTGLLLSDKDGNVRVGLGVEPKKGEGLVFLTPSGKESAALFSTPDGSVGLSLSDKEGRERAVLGHTALERTRTGAVEQTAASSLVLFDKEGKVLWKAP